MIGKIRIVPLISGNAHTFETVHQISLIWGPRILRNELILCGVKSYPTVAQTLISEISVKFDVTRESYFWFAGRR